MGDNTYIRLKEVGCEGVDCICLAEMHTNGGLL